MTSSSGHLAKLAFQGENGCTTVLSESLYGQGVSNQRLPPADHAFGLVTLDELLPADNPARFFVQAVEELDLEEFEKEFPDSRGLRGYPPCMLIALWLYGYATRVNTSRKLEEATRMSQPFMFIASGSSPDHTTLSTFRKRHGDEFKRLSAQAIQVLVGSGVITLSSLAVDGTKARACVFRENLITAKTAGKRVDAYGSIIADLTEASDRADEQEASEAAAVSKIDLASQETIRKLLFEVERLERLEAQLEEMDEAVRTEAKAKVEAYEKSQEENGKARKGECLVRFVLYRLATTTQPRDL